MNTALFEQHKSAITGVIADYLKHHKLLDPGDTVNVQIEVVGLPIVTVQVVHKTREFTKEELDGVLAKQIHEIDFGNNNARIQNALATSTNLWRTEVRTLGQLVRLSFGSLGAIESMGRKSVRTVSETLESMNLYLGTDHPIGPIEQSVIEQLRAKSS